MPVQQQQRKWQDSLQTLVFILLFIILSGWLLTIGQNFLLPLFAAVISMYILGSLTKWLGTLALLKKSPEWLRRLLVLAGFIVVVLGLSHIVITTGERIVNSAAAYQHNLEKMIIDINAKFGGTHDPDWQWLREITLGRLDMRALFTTLMSSLSSLTGAVVLVVVYAMFLINERGQFSNKFAQAFPGQGADQTKQLLLDINQKIGEYLAIKTLINVILAVISLVIMWLCGVEYALFWALVIGLLNYIPYIGSLLGVIFPVLLTLLQFGSIERTLLVAVLLTCAQMYVGNILEPKMIGKQVNLSPFVTLVSLSLWSSLWGVAGAVLAIPLTSMLVIILGAFELTRPFAILLVDDPELFQSQLDNTADETG